MQKEIPLWKGFLLSTALLRLVLLVGFLFVPYMTIGNRKLAGLALAGTAPAEAWQPIPDPVSGTEPPTPRSLATDPNANTVYLQSTSPFLVETFYMNKNIVRLPAADLPEETSVVYLLSHRQPAIPSRQWEPVSPTVPIAPRRDFLFQLPSAENQYRGILSREVLTHFPERTEDQSFEEAKRNSLRLYRGVLRSPLPPASEPNKTEETL